MLQRAESQSGGLDKLSHQLESRAEALRPIDRQLTQFEGLLAQWESAQTEAARGLEQTLARQGAVDALEAQVKHVFDLAEASARIPLVRCGGSIMFQRPGAPDRDQLGLEHCSLDDGYRAEPARRRRGSCP
jgi:hypothetical protein